MKPIPAEERRRMAIYSTIVNAEETSRFFGLPPYGPEQEAEYRAHTVALTKPLLDVADSMVYDHATFMATLFTTLQRSAFEQEHGPGSSNQISEESWHNTEMQLAHMINTGIIAGVTLLVEAGVLQYASEQTKETGDELG